MKTYDFIQKIRESLTKLSNYFNKNSSTQQISYQETNSDKADIHIKLATNDYIKKKFRDFKDDIPLSITDMKSNIIFINMYNWNSKKLSGSKDLYKEYVILHEFLHAYPFNLLHNENPVTNNKYNIMYQLTRLQGNEYDIKEFNLPTTYKTTYPVDREYKKEQLISNTF